MTESRCVPKNELYEYSDAPSVPKSVVDKANLDILEYHRGKGAFDTVFALAVLDAQEQVCLGILKAKNPGRVVSDNRWNYGYVPRNCTIADIDESNDAERHLLRRNRLRAADKYQEADAIRDLLQGWGYIIQDDANGTNWRVAA